MVRANVKVKTSKRAVDIGGKGASGFTFINLSEPVKQSKDKDLRKVVRSNAMRAYRQAMKQTAVKERSSNTDSDREDDNDMSLVVGNEELCDHSMERRPKPQQNCSCALGMRGFQSLSRCMGVRCARIDCDLGKTSGAGEPSTVDPLMYIGDCITDPFNTFPSSGKPQYISKTLDHCEPPPSDTSNIP